MLTKHYGPSRQGCNQVSVSLEALCETSKVQLSLSVNSEVDFYSRIHLFTTSLHFGLPPLSNVLGKPTPIFQEH